MAEEQEIPEIPAPRNESLRELMTLIKARNKLVYVVTSEEKRFLEDFYKSVAEPMKMDVWLWSSYQGLVKYSEFQKVAHATGELEKTDRPSDALAKIVEMPVGKDSRGSIFIMRDLHTMLSQGLPRQMRDALYRIRKKTIIITAPELGYSGGTNSGGLPMMLDKDTVVVEYSLMDKEDLTDFVKHNIEMTVGIAKKQGKSSKLKTKYSDDEVQEVVRACQGLTEPELQTAIKTSMVEKGQMDTGHIITIKEQLVRKSQILEFVSQPVDLNDVGGLDQAKEYFNTYRNSFNDDAKEYGVEPPAGILLTGVPGTGKSLLAKAICRAWGLPGIRLDIGKVMTGLVGGSEQRMREAIKQAEALAPCVLWIDEVEKAMSGVKSSNFSDAGTMSRVFGTFLTWMQEKKAEVVVLATANDITQVPPEFVRRFNEVFFVDLPVDEERKEIFEIHLRKRKRNPEKFDMKRLVEVTKNYTGAEIEKSIRHAIAASFQAGSKDVATKDIVTAVQETKPIYQVMGEKIAVIRSWARDRARYASKAAEEASGPGKQAAQIGGKEVELADALDLSDVVTPDVKGKKKGKAEVEENEDLVVT